MGLNKKLQGENNNEEDFGSDCPCGSGYLDHTSCKRGETEV